VIYRLTLMSCVLCRYYQWTFKCLTGGLLVRIYLIGIVVMHSIIILLVMILVNRSAQGAIYDTKARRVVPHLLVAKYELLRTADQHGFFFYNIFIILQNNFTLTRDCIKCARNYMDLYKLYTMR